MDSDIWTLNNRGRNNMFRILQEVLDVGEIWVPMRNQTLDFRVLYSKVPVYSQKKN